MNNARKQIAERLTFECKRRNLSASHIAELSNVAEEVVSAYLSGKKEININELKKICEPFNINATRLLFSKKYPTAKLSFRNTTRGVQNLAAAAENVFFLLKNSLPTYTGPTIERKSSYSEEKTELIAEAATLAKKIKKEHATPQIFLRTYSIPVIPINNPSFEFDAFLVREGQKIIICVNSSTPPHRIQFSLAHEISHIIFDSNIEVPVDSFIPNFYWKKWINQNESPEYFAYKFAQFYLVPFEQVFTLASTWPNINMLQAQQLVEAGITTKEVLANAINDSLLLHSPTSHIEETEYYTPTSDQFQRMDWEQGLDTHYTETGSQAPNYQTIINRCNGIRASRRVAEVYEYLEECKQNLGVIISKEQDNISEEIFQDIKEFLNIGNL